MNSSSLGVFFATQSLKTFQKDEISNLRQQLFENIILITEQEALELESYHHSNVANVCKLFQFPPSVQLVAHYLLWRYSICYTVVDRDFKHVMLAACYFASKLENRRLHLDEFCSRIKNVSRSLLEEVEFIFLKVLEHNICIFTPLPAIVAQLMQKSMQVNFDDFIPLLERIYQTNHCLCFTPQLLSRFVLSKLYPREFSFDDIPRELLEIDFDRPISIDKSLVKDVDKRILEFKKK
jgi:hypothetical protein